MCFGSKPATPKTPVVQAPPSRDDTATAATAERRRVKQQQGVYGNIFTSVLGDPNYGSAVQTPRNVAVASLGA